MGCDLKTTVLSGLKLKFKVSGVDLDKSYFFCLSEIIYHTPGFKGALSAKIVKKILPIKTIGYD